MGISVIVVLTVILEILFLVLQLKDNYIRWFILQEVIVHLNMSHIIIIKGLKLDLNMILYLNFTMNLELLEVQE